VDRFTVPPGVDFQQRLNQELGDKSMAVILESNALEVSKWTMHEVNTVKRNKLGMLSLVMPDRTRPLAAIDAADREILTRADFHGGPGRSTDPLTKRPIQVWKRLRKGALARIVVRIQAAHDHAILRRRSYVRRTIVRALGEMKVPVIGKWMD